MSILRIPFDLSLLTTASFVLYSPQNIYATIAVLRLLRAVVRSSQAAAMQFSASFNFSFKEFALQVSKDM